MHISYYNNVSIANLHLLYARFIAHFLHDIGILKEKEPFRHFMPQVSLGIKPIIPILRSSKI